MLPVSPDLQKGVSGGCSDSLFRCTKYTETRVTDPGGDRPDPNLTLFKNPDLDPQKTRIRIRQKLDPH